MSKQREHGITWTDETWNPVRGCTRVSEGCRHCYAERVAARFSGAGQPYDGLAKITPSGPRWTGQVQFVKEHLLDPLRWKRPRRVFVNSMSDLFHESLPDEAIDRVFAVMALARQHTFQVLTKRPERMLKYLTGGPWGLIEETAEEILNAHPNLRRVVSVTDLLSIELIPLPNVWLGVSCENQAAADERIPLLLETPAAVRWVSAEPLLGKIDVRAYLEPECDCVGPETHGARCVRDRIDWIVVGGESGPGARPMHPEWARSLRDQCQAAGVPFHFKQWGEWWPISQTPDGWVDQNPTPPERTTVLQLDGDQRFDFPAGAMTCLRVGKRVAGRLLDGRTWDEFPEARARKEAKGE